ncbi:mutS protein homolog 4-like [Aricia agestis]|uniref:mutS protein homolog 4-like n=1 Tax=Aricia agestis TaxID=91739 RepID=UPI001C206010|nr:mutS protein homolog 4-like [Aricia agestis]
MNKGPRYDFSAERSSSKSRKSSMGPPSGPPPVKRKTLNNSSSRQDSSWSGARPRVLANDSDIVDGFSTPKNRPTALRYISSSSRGGHSNSRSLRSTSTSVIEASVILAISEGRGMARGEIGMAAVDLRHPHLVLCQFSDTLLYTHTLTKINLFHPVEIIVPHTFCEGVQPNQLYKLIKEQFPQVTLTAVQRRHFNDTAGRQNIQSLCIPQYSAVYHQVIHKFYALTAAAAVLKYVEYIQCVVFARESLKIEYHSSENTMTIDVGTATQLELVQPLIASAGHTCCLLGVLGPTYTIGGIRALRAAILQPSCKKDLIEARLDAVQELIENDTGLIVDLQDVLRKLMDIDKILLLCIETPHQNADKYGEAQLHQTLLLKTTMELVPKLLDALKAVESGKLRKIKMDLENPHYKEIVDRIRNVIQEDAHPEKGTMGSLQRCFAIKPEINGLLDVARRTYSELIDDIQKIVEQLSETYDLPLRLNQNAMKGFHIILPVAPKMRRHFNVEDLPPIFIQVVFTGASVTMTTEDLVVLDHQTKESLNEIQKLSNIIIEALLKELRPFMPSLYKLCEDVAELDILLALAQASSAGSYIRPEFGDYMEVRNSVHPLLDYNSQVLPVPNDIFASPEYNFTIITGPNMGGKSIYIKQVAIQQIMAQLGCFVPATNAVFRLCDRIFSRIGFNDSVEFNASTYVIEMKEMQHILKGLTSSSLVIIDELCRGTSIEEGTSIAWAICEELILSNAFTFFTTHFLYLTRLQDLYCNVVNRHTSVREEEVITSDGVDKKLIYEHKLEAGVTTVKNYGLSLAAKTNLPKHTVDLAKELAELIEANKTPSEIRTPIQHFNEVLYKLNADIQKEYRLNHYSDETIKHLLNNFKIQNPQIIESIQMQNSIMESKTTFEKTEDSAKDSAKPEVSTESDKTPIIPEDNVIAILSPELNNEDNNNQNYTSVKSSTDLLRAYVNPPNDNMNESYNEYMQNNKTIKETNLNNDTDEILESSNSKDIKEQYLKYLTEDLNTSTIHNNSRILSTQKSSSNIFEKSSHDVNLKEIPEINNNNRNVIEELDDFDKNSISDTESDIADALTQIIEDTIDQSDEELMEETIKEINSELQQDTNVDFDLLTPPLGFRD